MGRLGRAILAKFRFMFSMHTVAFGGAGYDVGNFRANLSEIPVRAGFGM